LVQSGEAPACLDDIVEVPGYGVEAHHRGRRIRLGRAVWVGAEQGADTASWFHIEGTAPVEIRFSDSLRPGAQDLVRALRSSGLSVHMLSGDVPGPVAQLAASVGIDDWTAEASPADKVAHIRSLTEAGHKVLMVGDGLNDTGALAAATVSISPASALDAARVASDMVLIGQSLAPVEDALRIARQSTRRIRENFAISAGYNLIAVPIALIGLATPLLAALAMSLSSITVTLNALRMR
jgi:Cu2+-exporting ATPase